MASPPTSPPARRRPRHAAFTRSAFTLIELMISIALVVILILGVNQVFQSTLQAVGAGQAFVASVRDGRAAQTTFGADLNGAANDGPFFIIHSAGTYAFRNRADLAADKDQDASTYTLTTPDDTNVYPSTYNFRNHRLDVLTFFARGLYPAQTGDTSYVYPNAASEARVWYGFLKLPDGSYLDPIDTGYSSSKSFQFPAFSSVKPVTTTPTSGANPSANPNNFFATDWVLGRVATLLVPSPSTAIPPITSYFSYNTSPKSMWNASAGVATKTSPLADSSQTTDSAGNKWFMRWSRLDVAMTSIDNYSQQLTSYLANGGAGTDWYDNFGMGTLGTNPVYGNTRELFQCNPFVTTTSATAANTTKQERVARTTPYFLKGCTQFIVEYAGDFVQQDNDPNSLTYGQVQDLVTTTNGKGDGIDFVVDPVTKARSTRWYGLPRNPTGNPVTIASKSYQIPGNTGAPFPGASATATGSYTGQAVNSLTQVIPLRDVIASSATAVGTLYTALHPTVAPAGVQPVWIERSLPEPTKAPADYGNGSTGMQNGDDYLVAWGPDSDAAGIPRPKMIRITITLDDPSGRLADGHTYQFVYTLP